MRAVAGQNRGQGDVQAHPLIDSLQGLIGIIAGLGLANALAVFFEPDAHHSIRSGGLFAALADNGRALDPAINWLLPVASLLLLFVNTFRFYHLNFVFADTTKRIAEHNSWYLPLSFATICAEGMVIASMSFFIERPPGFFLLFALTLGIDVLWALLSQLIVRHADDRQLLRITLAWLLNNGAFALALLVLVFVLRGWRAYAPAGFGLVVVNTLISLRVNWSLLFGTAPVVAIGPRPRRAEVSREVGQARTRRHRPIDATEPVGEGRRADAPPAGEGRVAGAPRIPSLCDDDG